MLEDEWTILKTNALKACSLDAPKSFLLEIDDWQTTYEWFDNLRELKDHILDIVHSPDGSHISGLYDGFTGEKLTWNVKGITVENESRYAFGERMNDWSDWGATFWDKEGNISPGWRYKTMAEAVDAGYRLVRSIDPIDVVVYAFKVTSAREGQELGEIWYGVEHEKPFNEERRENPHFKPYWESVKFCPNFIEEVLRIPYNYRLTSQFRENKALVDEARAEWLTGGHHGPHFRYVWLWRSQWEKEWHVASYDDYTRFKAEIRGMLERGYLVGFVVDTKPDAMGEWTQLDIQVSGISLPPREEKPKRNS